MTDLMIRGTRVVNGTGAPATTADVAVRDGRIVEVGMCRARRVDADGLALMSDVVDVYTHCDAQITWDRTLHTRRQ